MSKEQWVIRRGERDGPGLFGLFGPFDGREEAVDYLVKNGIREDDFYFVDVVRIKPLTGFVEAVRESQEDVIRMEQMASEGGEH